MDQRFSKPSLRYSTPFDDCLDPGERVLWSGQPRQGIFLRSSDWALIPFSILWGGFAIFWETMALTTLQKSSTPTIVSIIFPLWGVPFVLIGLYLMIGRFFVDAWLRRRTWYAITDRRALIVSRGISRKITSFDLRTVGEVNFTEHADGTGSLSFGPVFYPSNNRANAMRSNARTFDHVPDAAEAYRMVRQVQQAPATATM